MVSQMLYSTARADVLQMDANGCTGLFMGENRISPSNVELHNCRKSRKRAAYQVNRGVCSRKIG
jgi:hypothetical protein